MACGGSPRPDGKLARNRCRCTPRQNSRHALWHCGGGATGNKGRDTMKSILTGVPMALTIPMAGAELDPYSANSILLGCLVPY
jgi:hypothetical protein